MQVHEKNHNSVAAILQGGNRTDDPVELSRVIRHFPSAIVITDRDGKPVGFNQSAVEVIGPITPDISLEQWPKRFGLLQAGSNSSYPWKDLPLAFALRGESAQAEEIVHLHGDDQEMRWISISAKPIISGEGKINGALVYLADITSRKNNELAREKQLRLAEASYVLSQQIAKIGNDPLQILNTVVHSTIGVLGDGCVAALQNSSNDSLKIVSCDHNKPSALPLLNNLVLSQEYGVEGSIARVILSGEPLLIQSMDQARLQQIARPEQLRYIQEIGIESLLVAPIKSYKGVIGTLSLFRDRGSLPYTSEDEKFVMDVANRAGLAIDYNTLAHSLQMESSGRRLAEEALDFCEARFRSIFTSTSLSIKLLDRNGNILETNPAFQHLLGFSEAELIGQRVARFWHPADVKHLQQILDKISTDHVRSYQREHRLVGKNGSIIWVNVAFTGIKKNEQDESPFFIAAIAENITERKRIEAEISQMKNRLQGHIEMERLQLAQELHDGPLQELYSAIYKIENWGEKLEQKEKEKSSILKQDLLKVIQELRNTAKDLRPPSLTNFGLEKAIRSHAEEFKEQHPELTIHLNLAQDRKILPEDIRLILFRIYQHSLTNVVRHAQANEVNIYFCFDAEEAQLEISDNGIGFEVPNSWIELVKQGHFGLAGAVERVSLLDGSFTVESTPGLGTTARAVIPIRENLNDTESRGE